MSTDNKKSELKHNSKNNLKYTVKSNNYVGLLFFALVFASALYIIKSITEPKYEELKDPSYKELAPITTNTKTEILEATDEIKNLQNYLNTGDINTFKIYQSFYINNEEITVDNLNTETMLHIAYKYLEKTTNLEQYTKYITCDEATKVGLDTTITQCGGTKYPSTYYTVNHYITKEILKETIQKIFNRTISTFTNFYTTEDNLCYYIEDQYLCIAHNTKQSNKYSETEFIKAYKYNNKIEIIENYKFVNSGIYYKGFNSNEIGESKYISTFIKRNGAYYWYSTKQYKEN